VQKAWLFDTNQNHQASMRANPSLSTSMYNWKTT